MDHSNCECECDKPCDVGEYLDYENCKCRKKLVHKLVEECTENVEEEKLAKITSAEHESRRGCSFYTLYIVLYCHWFLQSPLELVLILLRLFRLLKINEPLVLKKDITRIKFGTLTQTTI